MKHRIDPKIDCVFKAILGAEENRNLLIHFLNAILGSELAAPITWVDILNPYNEKEFISDKLSIVDIKAKDAQQHRYQIEIQLLNKPYLPERIIYNWTDIYSQQLQSGEDYQQLKSTYSIWLLGENLLKNDDNYWHNYQLRDKNGAILAPHGGIWLLELAKFQADLIANEQQRWLKFFKDGEQLDDADLPDWMTTNEMRQAMNTLTVFSEKERAYFQYQARQEYLRELRTTERELKESHQREQAAIVREQAALEREKKIAEEKEIIAQEKEAALEREKQALLEIERLKALLANR